MMLDTIENAIDTIGEVVLKEKIVTKNLLYLIHQILKHTFIKLKDDVFK